MYVIDTAGCGGAESVVVQLARAFSASPLSCVVVLPGPGWLESTLAAAGIPVERVPSRGSFNLSYLVALRRVIRKYHVEAIHAHLFGPSIYASLAGLLTGLPVVVTFHGEVDIAPDERFLWMKRRVLEIPRSIVAVSPRLRSYLSRRLSIAESEIEVVPNGIDVDRFLSATPSSLRELFSIPESSFLIGSVGNIRPAKAYEIGLQVLQRLREDGMEVHWVVAGQPDESGELYAMLQAQARRLGVSDYTHFIGFVDEPERFLKALDGFLLCSRTEGHPLALGQAMVCGLPIVATACGAEAVISDGIQGWVVPVGAVDALASAVKEMANNTQEATRRGQRARARGLSDFDSRTTVARYREIYRGAH